MPLSALAHFHNYGPAMGAAISTCSPTAEATIKATGKLAASHTTAPTAYARINLGKPLTAYHTTSPTASARVSARGRMAAVGLVNNLTQDDVSGAVWQTEVSPGVTYQDAILALMAGGGGGLTPTQAAQLEKAAKNSSLIPALL